MCELFQESQEDFQRFDAAFSNRISYTKKIHIEVKEWVADNIARWEEEKKEWFIIELIPDELLPNEVFLAEGGFNRRRSNVSMFERQQQQQSNQQGENNVNRHVQVSPEPQ